MRSDRWLGPLLSVLSLGWLFLAYLYIPASNTPGEPGPRAFPNVLGYALLTLERLTGLAMPADVRNAVSQALPPAPVRAVMAWTIDTMLVGPDPQAATPRRWLAGHLLYIRAHWLRMPPGMLAMHLGRKALRRLRPTPA